MDPAALQNLRSLVHDCLAKHLYDGAIFFADKLVTLTGYAPGEVYTLAQAFFIDRQYRRCLHLLRTSELVDKDIRFRYLAARCLAETKEWEECLELLGGLNAEPAEVFAFPTPPSSPGSSLDYLSSVCLLRGKVYDQLENFPKAVMWYKEALARDPFNQEAFHALVERHKLTEEEESSLVNELAARLPEEQRWLGLLYRSKCKQYDAAGHAAAELALSILENTTPNQQSPGSAAREQQQQQQQQSSGGGDNSMGGGGGFAFGGGGGDDDISPSEMRGTPKAARRCSSASAMAISPIEEDAAEGRSTASPRNPQNGGRAGSGRMSSGGSGEGGIAGAKGGLAEGWGLCDSADVVASRAELLLRRGAFQEAHSLTSSVLDRDPFAAAVLPAHLAAAVHLGKKHELFSLSHSLIKAQPDRAVAWYAAGCYYFATNQFKLACQYFAKATGLERCFPPAWIGFAQAFASQDETDQAMAAFRTASRLFPGLHLPLLGMGLEYSRMNNLALAEQTLLRAHRRCPADASVAHELGTLAYRAGRYTDAVQWLGRAAAGLPRGCPAMWEPSMVNLGHALRKLRRYDEAIDVLTRALGAAPAQPGTFSALGFTHHLAGNVGLAIENYHKALGLRPWDDFAASMLAVAVAEETEAATAELTRSLQPLGLH